MAVSSEREPDYYQILGVEPYVTHAEIKKAWRQWQMVLHPDRAHGAGSEELEFRKEKTTLVNKAWAVLGNEQKRREYDVRRGSGPVVATPGGSRPGASGSPRPGNRPSTPPDRIWEQFKRVVRDDLERDSDPRRGRDPREPRPARDLKDPWPDGLGPDLRPDLRPGASPWAPGHRPTPNEYWRDRLGKEHNRDAFPRSPAARPDWPGGRGPHSPSDGSDVDPGHRRAPDPVPLRSPNPRPDDWPGVKMPPDSRGRDFRSRPPGRDAPDAGDLGGPGPVGPDPSPDKSGPGFGASSAACAKLSRERGGPSGRASPQRIGAVEAGARTRVAPACAVVWNLPRSCMAPAAHRRRISPADAASMIGIVLCCLFLRKPGGSRTRS